MVKKPNLSVGLVFDDSLDSNDGVAQHVKILGAWLSSQGHRVSYLVGETKITDWAGGEVYSLAKNQKVNFNGNKLSVPLPAGSSKIKALLRAESFDVLNVMMPYSPFMAQKLIKEAGPQTAVVGTFHIYPSGRAAAYGAKFLKILNGRSLGRFSDIISVSPAAADFAKETFKLESEIIPNPVNLTEYRRTTTKPVPGRIVFLGRLVKRKGASQMITAFAELAKVEPEARLIIAGDGPERSSLERLAKSLKVENKIELKGYIGESDKPNILASATIACFPSLHGESFGIVLIEAMAAGAGVVIGGDNPGYRSVLEKMPDLLVDPDDTQQFADKLHQLIGDEALRSNFHQLQQKEVTQYDINIVGPQIVRIYERAIARLTKNGHNTTHE